MSDLLIDLLMPHLLEIVSTLVLAAVTAALGVLAPHAKRWLDLEIEARHRAALHSAIMSGLRAALARNGMSLQGVAPEALVSEAVDYAERSVPDAIAALRGPRDVLFTLARSKLEDVAVAR